MTKSMMAQESAESSVAISNLLTQNQQTFTQLAQYLQENPPLGIVMIGRGTSDHAGVFAKYLFETQCGIPVSAAAPSVASVFGKTLSLHGFLAIAISQSGQSPDIVSQLSEAKKGGAYCIAIVNDDSSPLAKVSDITLSMHAGKEKAVAATKSYLCSLAMLLGINAYWQNDTQLLKALTGLPELLCSAVLDAQPLLTNDSFTPPNRCIVIGRGFGYAIAREVALKLKEVLGIQAEAFSSAEFLHGPVTLAAQKLFVVSISLDDATGYIHKKIVRDVAERGANVLTLSADTAPHCLLQPLLIMQRFYLDLAQLASTRGLNPDQPPGLKKITETK
ncbi:glucosamine-6-phosphate deaminase NagB-II [Agaribacter marinus]|uniref:Glutamine--fructose-6-phosphate aminotransferase n=1 Tax=Agaribacter marinus TaxID=1431249 RepID=A0AA37WI25_9ALTE|nr:SIS domain-containing protein [Agaribacter marinus]GLR70397.1 glutamine--fructose-6-phosphate aminotransferase [Agaribacter marinus]